MRLCLISAFGALALFLPAQERLEPGFIRFHPLLKALDRNQDGVISSEELQNAPAVLRKLDSNKDGSVSAEEMRPTGFGGRGGGEPGESRPPEASEIVKTLMAFDLDGDGKLSREEVPERMQGLFARADADKDGVLTGAELTKLAESQSAAGATTRGPGVPPGRGPMRMDAAMAALDTDRDGSISETEIQNSVAALKTLDKNGDGQITEDGVRPAFGPGRGGAFGREPRR